MISPNRVFLAFLGTTTLLAQPAIVYTHAPNGGPPWPVEDVYSMNADGSNAKALTNDGHSHNAVWSPDGKRVLFIHDAALQTEPDYAGKGLESSHPVELYVMDRDGGNRHLLRRIEPVIYSAAWSPDGTTIAITSGVPLRPTEPATVGLFLLRADGQGELRLLFRDAYTPAWSPDGKKLAFSKEEPRGVWTLHTANSDGSNDVQLTDPSLTAGSPSWSPDGKSLAFDQSSGRQRQIFVMAVDGSQSRQITSVAGQSCEHSSWSPDGNRLVFSCRSPAPSCGTVSSVGTMMPECTRRLFSADPRTTNPAPVQISESDGAFPELTP